MRPLRGELADPASRRSFVRTVEIRFAHFAGQGHKGFMDGWSCRKVKKEPSSAVRKIVAFFPWSLAFSFRADGTCRQTRMEPKMWRRCGTSARRLVCL
jgi:hypothetical protein